MTAGKIKSTENNQKASELSSPTHVFARRLDSGFSHTAFEAAMVPQIAGNLAIQQLFRAGAIQAKLSISQPGDADEQEADRIAEQVVSAKPVGTIQRKCAACAEGATCLKCEEEERVQPKGKSEHIPQISSKTVSQITSLRGGGQPLPPSVQAFFELRFGRDFSQVRVHTGSQPEEVTRAIQARAFTIGEHIVFANGSYQPHTIEGKQLIAHELTHTLQQSPRSANAFSESATLFRAPDEPETEPAEETAGTEGVESIYDNVLHFWKLRSGMGEAITEEEEKILENEDITARLVEEACASGSPAVPGGGGSAPPASLGLSDVSLLFSTGSESEEEFVFEFYGTNEDEVQLAKAYAYRVVLQLIHTRPATFADDEDFWSFHKDVTGYACSEDQTLGQIGDEFLKDTWAFPGTWAKRVQQVFIPDFQFWALESFRNSSYSRLRDAMEPIAPFLAENGLPLSFQESLYLSSPGDAELIRILRNGADSAKLLDAFFKAEIEALENDLELAFARKWLQWANEVVSAIATAQKSVNYDSFIKYGGSSSASFLISNRHKTNQFEADHLSLDLLEQDISYMAYASASIKRWLQKRLIDSFLSKQFDLADYLIVALDGDERLGRAEQWRSAKGFDPEARSFLIESLDLLDMAKDAGKDVLISYGIRALTGLWGVVAKEAFDFLSGLWESHEKISEARDVARDAKSVAKLQQASANLALIMASETLSIGLTLAQVPGLLKQAKQLRRGLSKGVRPTDQPAPSTKALDVQAPAGTTTQPVPTIVEPGAQPWMGAPPSPFSPIGPPRMLRAEGPPPSRSISRGGGISSEEHAFLGSTAKPNSKMETHELERELEIAHDVPTGRSLARGGEYVEEIVLENGHTWRRRADGVWCRFSNYPVCLMFGEKPTAAGMHIESVPPQRKPRRGEWDGTPGNSNFTPHNKTLNEALHYQPIPYRNGYPDFSNWAEETVILPRAQYATTSRDTHFRAADEILARRRGWFDRGQPEVARAEAYRQTHFLTWHHTEEGVTLQLVPRPLHEWAQHEGGMAVLAAEP